MNEHSFAERIPDILAAFRDAEKIAITTHVNPDGDAIGSALGLWNALTGRGKQVVVVNHSPTPANMRFLPGADDIHVFRPERDFPLLTTADVICVLDVNNLPRIESVGAAVEAAQCAKIVIDHHREPQEFADIYAIETDASSTCQMIAQLLFAGKYHISPATATALYTGIMTDSGNFRFPRTDAALHRLVAQLIECGADPVAIYEEVFNAGSYARVKLLGRALAGMELVAGEKICAITVHQADFAETGAHLDDTEGFVQNTLAIAGVQLGILFVELDGVVKASLRSKGSVSAANIAKQFGGGAVPPRNPRRSPGIGSSAGESRNCRVVGIVRLI